MPTTRHASELFVRGRAFTLAEGDNEATFWLQKVSDLDQKAVMKRANAEKSRALTALRDKTSDEFLAVVYEAEDMTREQMIDLLARDELGIREAVIGAELAGGEDSEWAKDGYLQGLFDAWRGEEGLFQRYAMDKEDVEANRVLDEIIRYQTEVTDRFESELASTKRHYEDLDDAAVLDRLVPLLIQHAAAEAWAARYNDATLFLACRKMDKREKYYFESLEQITHLPDTSKKQILDAYEALLVEVTEGKDWPASPASSPPSDSPETPEDSIASGQTVAST